MDLKDSKVVFFRKLVNILSILGDIGGFSSAIFDILLLAFSAYSAANFRLEFV
jgi:hypothetical protein